jgi:hypothetical protein
MPFNKIGGGQALYPPMTIPLLAGATYTLPGGQGIAGTFGSSTQGFTGYTLTGQYLVNLGPYCSLQMYDSAQQYWRNVPAANGVPIVISSDGTNYRIANTTGCPVGAIVTTGLGALTNGFNTVTVTPTTGSSTWNTIVGGSCPSALVSVTTTGSNYALPPQLIYTPVNQGSTPYIMPTAVAVLTGKSISSVTVLSVGAGMLNPPSITVIPAPGDTLGAGAVLTPPQSLTSGSLAHMWPVTYGTAVTVAPTFTFTPASSIAATAIMNFTVSGTSLTAISVVTAGASLGASTAFVASTMGGYSPQGPETKAAIVSNAYYDLLCIFPRPALVAGTTGTTGAISQAIVLGGSLGLVIKDAGFGIQGTSLGFVPMYLQMSAIGGATTTTAFVAAPVGGTNDQCVIQPI